MTALFALCLSLTTVPEDATFLFPRPIAAIGAAPKSANASDPDFDRAIGALRSAIRATRLERSEKGGDRGYGAGSGDSRELDRLLYASEDKAESLAPERQLYPADRTLDCTYRGFWQTRYEFSLGGRILGLRFGLLSYRREEAFYRGLRGYWRDYAEARVFFGAGTLTRFTICPIGLLGPYVSYSRHLPAGLKGRERSLVTQTFGTEQPYVKSPAISDRSLDVALQTTLNLEDRQFTDLCAVGVATVEPILIVLPSKTARYYVDASLPSRNRLRH